MNLTYDIIEATEKYCGGVAITCHPHLKSYWKNAYKKLVGRVKLNFHHVISDKKSVDTFIKIYNKYVNLIDYFVLLPLVVKGRATDTRVEYMYLFNKLKRVSDLSKIAFGAKFYYEHKDKLKCLGVSVYEPEVMSRYIDLVKMKEYNSSYDSEPIRKIKS